MPSARFSQEVGAPVQKLATPGGTLYVLPVKESLQAHGGAAPSLSVEGAQASLREPSGGTVEGDLRVFVPEGSEGRVVVTVLADGAPPEIRRRR